MAAEHRYLKSRAAELGRPPATTRPRTRQRRWPWASARCSHRWSCRSWSATSSPARASTPRYLVGAAAAAAVATSVADRLVDRAPADDDPDAPNRPAATPRPPRRPGPARSPRPIAVAAGTLALSTFFASRPTPTTMWEKGKQQRPRRRTRWRGRRRSPAGTSSTTGTTGSCTRSGACGPSTSCTTRASATTSPPPSASRWPTSSACGCPYGLMARAGIRPYLISQARAINLLYQYWIHTETIRSLGPAEQVLNTASHHRVHHGSNAAVHRPQPRVDPHRVGQAVRHVRARGRAGRLRPDQEHRLVQPGR